MSLRILERWFSRAICFLSTLLSLRRSWLHRKRNPSWVVIGTYARRVKLETVGQIMVGLVPHSWKKRFGVEMKTSVSEVMSENQINLTLEFSNVRPMKGIRHLCQLKKKVLKVSSLKSLRIQTRVNGKTSQNPLALILQSSYLSGTLPWRQTM